MTPADRPAEMNADNLSGEQSEAAVLSSFGRSRALHELEV